MKSISGLSPLVVPPHCENLSSLSRTGEPIVAWTRPRHCQRVRAFRLIATVLGRAPHYRLRHGDTLDAAPSTRAPRLWGTLAWT